MENFIAEIQGSARFRTGSRYVHHTRLNQTGILIQFQFNDEQAYILEFTEFMIRFYRDGGIIVEAPDTITGATQADPCVITATAHGWANGDEVFINDVVGMTELNGSSYLVANITANTAELTDIDGVDIDSTGFTAYSSGGVGEKIYEVASPYHNSDLLFELKYAQNADVMYITDPHGNDVRKLTRTDHNAWTLATYTRTQDKHPSRDITGATQANPCVITAVAHGFSDGDVVAIHDIVGMVELNHQRYFINNKTANTFELQDLTGTNIDSTGFTAYVSDGTCGDPPQSVGFYEGRLIFGGSFNHPETFWLSRSPDTSGNTRFDDFTTGTDADHAAVFTLAPAASGKVDHIEWVAGANEFLVLGTFGGLSKASGGGINESITPTNISVKPMSEVGCADIMPIPQGSTILYVQRGNRALRSLEYNALDDNYVSVDRNLVADHIFEATAFCKQIAFEQGSPDIVWSIKSDGELAGVTLKSREDVSGWHRQRIGGDYTDPVTGAKTKTKVLSVANMPQTNNFSQTWMIVERKIGASGTIRRFVEYFTDTARVPSPDAFFTGVANETSDITAFENAMFTAQKAFIHVDSAISFDASVGVGSTITPAAVTGSGIEFTAGSAIFSASDIGRQIWKKDLGGGETGQAVIQGFTDSTHVDCDILVDFDSTDAIADGDWYFTVDTISNINHLAGATVVAFADGIDLGEFDVTAGGVLSGLGTQAGEVHIGFRYIGLLKSLDIEVGGIQGAAQTRQRNVEKAAIRFLGTLKANAGTHRYSLEEIPETN